MKAVVFEGKQKVAVATVPDPRLLAPTDVLVKIELAGICGSDLHPYHERERGLDHGTVMGHEAVSRVEEVGAAVKTLRRGDLVFSPFTTNCGGCFYCQIGLTCRCTSGQLFGWVEGGKGLHGLQAQYARVPLADATLLKVPEGVTPEEALLLGDVFSTGFFGADSAGIRPDGVYAVVGCGPVGLMAVVGARELGAGRVYAVDSVPERLALAESYGAIPLNFAHVAPVDVVRAATEGRGADAVIEGVGSPSAEKLAYDLVRPGGTISVVGVHPADRFTFSPPDAYNKNLTYKVGRCPARHYMERLMPVARRKRYDLSAVISHRLPLADAVRAYDIFDRKLESCTKVVLKP
jgi:threonine dehydrogenase-like Zn-dependent dehydrogenase